MSCDVIVYQITGSKSQVDEAKWAVEGKYGPDLGRQFAIEIILRYILYMVNRIVL